MIKSRVVETRQKHFDGSYTYPRVRVYFVACTECGRPSPESVDTIDCLKAAQDLGWNFDDDGNYNLCPSCVEKWA